MSVISVASARAPHYVVMVVTPGQAQEWLTKNTHNRPINKKHVNRLCGDLTAGRWKFNPDPVSFSPDGTVLNGQHRLTAIAKAGVAATLAVCFDVPPDAMSVMDQGVPRSLRDVAGLSARTAAVTRSMFNGLKTKGFTYPSKSELATFYRRFADEIEFAVGIFTAKSQGLRIAAIPAVVARAACGHIERRILVEFATVISTGMPVAGRAEDATVIRLREKLIQARFLHGSSREMDSYASTERALFAFSRGQALAKIFPAKEELFPLPERGGE